MPTCISAPELYGLTFPIAYFNNRFHHRNFLGQLFQPRGHLLQADSIGNPRLRIDLVLFEHADNRGKLSATVSARINRDLAAVEKRALTLFAAPVYSYETKRATR